MGKKLPAIDAAKSFIQKNFPDCDGAILAGSVIRGEETETSDLDIVIFDGKLFAPYRESFIDFGWPIEVFVHNWSSYKAYFFNDCERARPSLPRMVAEGIILRGEATIASIRNEAEELLARGPKEWTNETISLKRYFLTDTLDDFIGCTNRAEAIFVAGSLAEATGEFVLRTNNSWIGSSKWILRALKKYDMELANHFVDAFDTFYKTGDKNKVIQLVDEVLQPHGGRLFEGFSIGKPML
ncbi:nucleotidyltransferase domain-containing protein [Planococcus soli]|uniref:nucleotidyltransferase domain-containing protein n=1 Tax=Planococcus soli TaxID=2666072 RepID=UPI00115D8127|nr:nucleotidyltransferase domain-containing protein [Planococcus soli]